MQISNNTILITGGSSGIGFEFVKQLSQHNNTIIITGRNQAKLDQVKKQFPKVHTIQSDDKHIVTVDKKNKKITLQVPADGEHQIFLGGDGVTGTYALIPGSINVYIRTG